MRTITKISIQMTGALSRKRAFLWNSATRKEIPLYFLSFSSFLFFPDQQIQFKSNEPFYTIQNMLPVLSLISYRAYRVVKSFITLLFRYCFVINFSEILILTCVTRSAYLLLLRCLGASLQGLPPVSPPQCECTSTIISSSPTHLTSFILI